MQWAGIGGLALLGLLALRVWLRERPDRNRSPGARERVRPHDASPPAAQQEKPWLTLGLPVVLFSGLTVLGLMWAL